MTPQLIFWLIFGYVLFSVGFYFFSIFFASWRIFYNTLMRKSKEEWGRSLSLRTEQTVRMDEEGMAWQKEHDAYKKDVHIVNDGLNLYGEYYDFGADKAVMILSGRTESLRYGYYFARPYSEMGYNVLVVDSRCHGHSDGTYLTLGFEESRDDLAWVRLLQDSFGVKSVVFHGICIGAAGGMLAITSPDCPSCVKGLVTEGMFATFSESMKNHLIERKRLLFPVMRFIDFWLKRKTGHSMYRGPIDVIASMKKPLLMIQSKKDPYSAAEKAKELYERCASREKKLVLYEEGGHSMLRFTDTSTYDREIQEFLSRLEAADQQ